MASMADFPLPDQFTDGEALGAAKYDARITAYLNVLAANAEAGPQGFLGGSTASGTTNPGTSGANVPASAQYVFTLPVQRRVRIVTSGTFTSATAPARYFLISAYNAGGTAGTPIVVGTTRSVTNQATGSAGANTGYGDGTVLLAANTYIAYPATQRSSGGAAGDTCGVNSVDVYDEGST